MRESRVNVWTNPTLVDADATYTGPTINLLEDYVGSHLYGTGQHGFPVEFIAKSVVTGTGDGFTVTMSWEISLDGSTWTAGPTFGVYTIDTDGNFQKDGADYTLTRAKLQSRLKTARGYIRVKAVALGITNGESLSLSGFMADGTVPYADTGVIS